MTLENSLGNILREKKNCQPISLCCGAVQCVRCLEVLLSTPTMDGWWLFSKLFTATIRKGKSEKQSFYRKKNLMTKILFRQVYKCQRCNFVLWSTLNCLNLSWQLVEHVGRLRSKTAILEVATSNFQKWRGFAQSWVPCMPIWHPNHRAKICQIPLKVYSADLPYWPKWAIFEKGFIGVPSPWLSRW